MSHYAKWAVVIGAAALVGGLVSYAAMAGGSGAMQSRPIQQQSMNDAIQRPGFLQSNPIIHDSGRQTRQAACSDWVDMPGPRRTHREVIHASALDPDRDQVDRGSRQHIDRLASDGRGGYYRQRGHLWTSNGIEHSDVNLSHVYPNGNPGVQEDTTHVQKSPKRSKNRKYQ